MRSRNPRSAAACAPPSEVGRVQRPDLDAKQRGTAAAVNQHHAAPNSDSASRAAHPVERWLTDDDGRATYALVLSLHPRKQHKRPILAEVYVAGEVVDGP